MKLIWFVFGTFKKDDQPEFFFICVYCFNCILHMAQVVLFYLAFQCTCVSLDSRLFFYYYYCFKKFQFSLVSLVLECVSVCVRGKVQELHKTC